MLGEGLCVFGTIGPIVGVPKAFPSALIAGQDIIPCATVNLVDAIVFTIWLPERRSCLIGDIKGMPWMTFF